MYFLHVSESFKQSHPREINDFGSGKYMEKRNGVIYLNVERRCYKCLYATLDFAFILISLLL